MRREIRQPNRSWRVDESYVRVAGRWTYLYRAVDSAGDTIEFLLSPYRDRIAAKGFLQFALSGQQRPRVITVDGHPAYSSVINELKRTGQLGLRCRCRRSRYLNNRIEQDHRFVKKRVVASQWFRSVEGALRTIAGYEAIKHDSKRADSLASQGRHRWAGTFHRANVRARCLIFTWFPLTARSYIPVCDTTRTIGRILDLSLKFETLEPISHYVL